MLREFLESMPAGKTAVALANGRFSGNLTIVGDWFGAKATAPQPGSDYRQTLFSHHAPTVLRWIDEFDQEMDDRLQANGTTAQRSCDLALAQIDQAIARLKA
jgi:hypothetical protein